MNKNWNRTE